MPSTSVSDSVYILPANPNPGDTHLHATLQRIDRLANEDVEMQAPVSESSTFLVLDTNILLHHFDAITQFVEDAERLSVPVLIVIPGVVIYELDGQKNRDGLAWFARRASTWLLEKVKERKIVKGQANEETCKSTRNWKMKERGESRFAAKILRALPGIPTITPSRNWSSREIAWALFGDYGVNLSVFSAYKLSYKNPKTNSGPQPVVEDAEEMMMVDDDESLAEITQPSHALDLLHLQVVDHFTRLLIELVGRVGGPEIHNCGVGGASASQYAPRWQKTGRPYTEWTVAEAWEYLEERRKSKPTSPRIDIFLSKPYTVRGARRGQDWSRKDWEVVMMGLSRLGELWDEESIGESIGVLEPHVEGVFAMKLRPTGI
ncbi:hypothetical protein H0H92_012558 [Tricholoma furcatifolium]|nr:hypothetical protein H0H92_012558 [Tricholoma furcatifolium]